MASGFTTLTNEHLIRSDLWSKQLKQLLLDDLFAMGKLVRVLDGFPDGDTFHIPSLGEAEVLPFTEGMAIKYNKFDTGDFTFSWDEYNYSANTISKKFKQDSYWASDVESAFVPRQHRALMESVETNIFAKANAGQTASSLNTINTAAHRFVASGTGETMTFRDFSRARYALTKANVPKQNLVAIVDPSVTFTLENQPNAVNLLSPMPQWADVNTRGLVTGFQFRYNFMGFDVYESNYLPNAIAETVDGDSVTVGVANLFFSASAGDTMPMVGGFKQTPEVESDYNKDLQQWEYLTIARWGFKLYRPENMVIILSDTDQVS